MTAAANLLEAANLAPQNLRALWETDTLKPKVIAFWQAIVPAFPEEIDNNRPVNNWIAIIAAFAPSIMPFADTENPGVSPWPGGTITLFGIASDYVYRLCKFGYYYPLITPAQKAALLAAYNAQFS